MRKIFLEISNNRSDSAMTYYIINPYRGRMPSTVHSSFVYRNRVALLFAGLLLLATINHR